MTDEKRVCLVGTGHGWQLCPTEGEVWTLNDLGIYRYTTMFWDMHNFDWTFKENVEHYSHVEEDLTQEARVERARQREARWQRIELYCRQKGVPLMSVKRYDRIPTSIAFPIYDIIAYFGTDFINSAIACQLAYAIYKGYTVIDCYGINVEMGSEWVYQRDCVSYWVGQAHGRGIRCTVSGSERRPLRILDRRIYGFDIPQREAGKKHKIILEGTVRGTLAVYDESGRGSSGNVAMNLAGCERCGKPVEAGSVCKHCAALTA